MRQIKQSRVYKLSFKIILTFLIVNVLISLIPNFKLYSQVPDQLNITKGYTKDKKIHINDKFFIANLYFYWDSYIKLDDLIKTFPNYSYKLFEDRVELYDSTIYQNGSYRKVGQFSIGHSTYSEAIIYNTSIYLNLMDLHFSDCDFRINFEDVEPDPLYPVGRYEGNCGTIELYPGYAWVDCSQYISHFPVQQVRKAKFDIIYNGKSLKGTYFMAPAFEGMDLNPNILYIFDKPGSIDYNLNILESNGDFKIEFSSPGKDANRITLMRVKG